MLVAAVARQPRSVVGFLVMRVEVDLVRCHEMTRWLLLFDRHMVDRLPWERLLTPGRLQRLVLAAIALYIGRAILARQVAHEEEQRSALSEFLGGRGAVGGASA